MRVYEAPGASDAVFACRRCLVRHYSEAGPTPLRALSRAIKIRTELGGSADPSQPFPPRPRWMRKASYEALRAEALRLRGVPASAWCTYAAPKHSRLPATKAGRSSR